MPDISLDWNTDFKVAANGDLATVDQYALTQQRIIVRLMTAVRGYIWHLEYGAGLPQRIGRVARALDIQSLVRSQILLEASVAKLPQPTVSINTDQTLNAQGAYLVTINYVDAGSGAQVALTFDPTTGLQPPTL